MVYYNFGQQILQENLNSREMFRLNPDLNMKTGSESDQNFETRIRPYFETRIRPYFETVSGSATPSLDFAWNLLAANLWRSSS